MNEIIVGRPIKIDGMAYAPTNEQGVVYLFGRIALKLGFHVEQIQTGFPDCTARRHGKTCRIEFEYRASSYVGHHHPPRGADVVICWDNDWENRPRQYQHLEVIDLKKYVGALPRIYVVGCDERARGQVIDKRNTVDWSVSVNAQAGDLLVMYRKSPASEIRDLWRITGPFFNDKEWGLQAWIKLVTRLDKPITYGEMKREPTIRDLSVVRKRFQGKSDITNDWPLFYDMIVRYNPKAKSALRSFQSE